MAVERGYEQRVMPSEGAAQPLPTAENFGASIGRAVGALGDDMHRRDIRAEQLDRQQRGDQEWSDFAHRSALHQQNMDGIVQQLRANPTSADYREHVQLVSDADDAAREGLLSGITEKSVLQRANAQLDGFRTRLAIQENGFAQTQRIAKTVTDARDYTTIQSNRLRNAKGAQDWTAALEDLEGYVGGLSLLTPDQKAQMLREGEQGYTVSFVNGLIHKSPAGALSLLEGGTFDSILDARQIEQLRNGSMVEVRRAEAQAQHAANLQNAATREEIATVTEKSSQGIDVSADLPGLIERAGAMGDTSTVAKLQGLARDSAFAKVWGAVSPLQRQARLQALQAIPEAKRTEGDQAELKWLVDKSGGLDGQFNSDPVGFAARTAPQGMGPPPLGEFSPPELAQRERWMRQAQGAYGSMQPLSAAEAHALQERATSSDVGYREVLSSLGGFSSKVASQAVRQVLPNDPFAEGVVALAPNVQRQALDGREVRKANPQILNPPRGTDNKPDPDVVAQLKGLRTGFTLALGNIPAKQRNGILEAAEAIAADALSKNGQLSEQMSGAMLARSLDAALGSTGEGATKKGGIGWWGGSMYLLPSRVSQSGFDAHISDFLRKHPDMAPVNPDGSPANVRAARPLAIGGDRYQFMVGNRVLMGKDGKPWIRTVTGK